MAPPPVVTGLSPIEGPPGTKLTIRGEFLGLGPYDLVGLTICGCDCLLSAEWKSTNKIVARSGPSKGQGDIVVTTASGGIGSSTVQFRSYHETIGPMKESAVWVEEAWGRRSLSPGSYQQDDPLGLSVEGNDNKLPQDLNELFPDSSGDLASDRFSAAWFLLENHHTTTFSDLKAGLSYLKRKVESQKEGKLSFLKANVGSVLDQVDTMVSLKERFENDCRLSGGEPTFKLERAIKEAEHECNKLFDNVLARRDRADATRSALSVLTRFRFLFCLPCVIDRNIKRGDYDVVINDYARVKNLFRKSQVPVFQRALAETEKRIVQLRETLRRKLRTMPVTVEEQKRLIRYLANLEASGEPAWEAITSRCEHMAVRMQQCCEEHASAEAEDGGKPTSVQSSGCKLSSKLSAANQDVNTVPQCVLFVEELCEIVSTSFPDLRKLRQAYFSGELLVKIEPGRISEYKHAELTLMNAFCKYLRTALLPKAETAEAKATTANGQVMAAWLPHCLRCVRSAHSLFMRLDLPAEAVAVVARLITDVRLHCMGVLFRQACDKVRALADCETWRIEYTSCGDGVTDLPAKFEQILEQTVKVVRESVLVGEQQEQPLLDSDSARAQVEKHLQDILVAFCVCLEALAFRSKSGQDEDRCAVSQLIGAPSTFRPGAAAEPAWEQKLLTVLSNCRYTVGVVMPSLPELFRKNGYPVPEQPIKAATTALDNLDKLTMEAYLEHKCDPLVGTIEPSMYLGRFDWDALAEPHDIRPYAKECINNLIGVHSEVTTISPRLVERVLAEVVETVAEELSRLMSCVREFSVQGNQQARADIKAIEMAVEAYATPRARNFFKEAVDCIPPLPSKSHEQNVEEIVERYCSRMKMQILCFKKPFKGNANMRCK